MPAINNPKGKLIEVAFFLKPISTTSAREKNADIHAHSDETHLRSIRRSQAAFLPTETDE